MGNVKAICSKSLQAKSNLICIFVNWIFPSRDNITILNLCVGIVMGNVKAICSKRLQANLIYIFANWIFPSRDNMNLKVFSFVFTQLEPGIIQ